MVELVAYPSRWHIALLVLISVGLMAIGLDMIGAFGTPSPPLQPRHLSQATRGWLCIFGSGTCAVVFGRMLFQTVPLLRIDQNGVWWHRWSNQIIPWSEITKVTEFRARLDRTIVLHLRNPDKFPRPQIWTFLSKINRALGGGDVAIGPFVLDKSFEEIMAAIELYRN